MQYLDDSLHSFVESNIQPSGHGFIEPDVTLGHLKHLGAGKQFITKSEREGLESWRTISISYFAIDWSAM